MHPLIADRPGSLARAGVSSSSVEGVERTVALVAAATVTEQHRQETISRVPSRNGSRSGAIGISRAAVDHDVHQLQDLSGYWTRANSVRWVKRTQRVAHN